VLGETVAKLQQNGFRKEILAEFRGQDKTHITTGLLQHL
jgi:hypothetical protein